MLKVAGRIVCWGQRIMATPIANSTFLEATSYGLLPESQIKSSTLTDIMNAFGATGTTTGASLTVAIVLNRNQDAGQVLDQSWGDRQRAIQDPDLWSKYGADVATYNHVKDQLTELGGAVLDTDGYISSAASRTIWVSLDATAFQKVFGTDLYLLENGNVPIASAWAGALSLPDSIASDVGGFWVDQNVGATPVQVGGQGFTLQEGPQGAGNYDYGQAKSGVTPTPTAVADYYHYPLNALGHLGIDTPNIGLVEPLLNLSTYNDLLTQLNEYRQNILGIAPLTAEELVQTQVSNASGSYTKSEMTLDVSIVSGAAPNSSMIFYSKLQDQATTFAATQQAIWDTTNNPAVLSSSFSDIVRYAPDSPFAWAYDQLMQDAALRNVTIAMSAGDGGSGQEYANGVTNGRDTHLNKWALVVSATSLSPINTAELDPTLTTLVDKALALDPQTLFNLTASGLNVLPTQLPSYQLNQPISAVTALTEAVWNQYVITNGQMGQQDYTSNYSGSGGVDVTQPIPEYQIRFGLSPVDVSNGHTGRGVPDVSALGGGSMFYYVLYYLNDNPQYQGNAGTSSATPMWASLTAQINAIFADQGLPHLGYYNDLLYQAAALTPGAFNDVSLGNNVSSYYLATPSTPNAIYDQATDQWLVPTGLGYAAGAGYDTASGLGTPNGLLLARTLANIAHNELYGTDAPVFKAMGNLSGTADRNQTLLVQSTLGSNATVNVSGADATFEFGNASSRAWTARLAEQSLQTDFSADLVKLLDGASQSAPGTVSVAAGESVGVTINDTGAGLYQAKYTNDYGFVSWGAADGAVTLARPVMVAETAKGDDHVNAVVRLRQSGALDEHLMLYRVDDLEGHIKVNDGSGHIITLAPGDAGYAAAAAQRAYKDVQDKITIDGAGYGQYSETQIKDVNHGDIIAMSLKAGDHTYWGFTGGNETVNGEHVTHLWSYGNNTYGFEDLYGGGDRDYNDLIVQLDFTSTAGSGLLV